MRNGIDRSDSGKEDMVFFIATVIVKGCFEWRFRIQEKWQHAQRRNSSVIYGISVFFYSDTKNNSLLLEKNREGFVKDCTLTTVHRNGKMEKQITHNIVDIQTYTHYM